MNMKLSYRDKVIFIVAIIIIILVGGFFLFVRPKFAEIEVAQSNFEAKQQERDEIDAKISTLPDIIENIKTVAREVGEKQEIFMTEQDPYLNEIYIRDALSGVSGMQINSMTTNYTTAIPIEKYMVLPTNIVAYENKINADLYNELPQEVYDRYNNTPDPVYPNTIIGVTEMEVAFESDLALKRAYDTMDKIAEDNKAIILNTIATGDITSIIDPEVEIKCQITLYSVFPLNVEQVLQETPEVKAIETPPAE